MAGSILLLQRSGAPVSQRAEASLQSSSHPSRAPHSAHRVSGAEWPHGGSGAPRPQDVGTIKRSRNRILERRLLRRHWFHSQVTQTQIPLESRPSHGPGRHEGIYLHCISRSLHFLISVGPSSVCPRIPVNIPMCTELLQLFERQHCIAWQMLFECCFMFLCPFGKGPTWDAL